MKRVPFVLLIVCVVVGLAAPSQPPQQDKARTSIRAGEMYLRHREYSQAVASFTEAIKADPGSVEAYLKRAWAYLEWGGKANDDKALADAVKAIEIEPANSSAHFARGKVYFNRAKSAKEAKNLKDARDLFGRALADLEIARAANPDWVPLLVDIGHANFARGDLDRALAAFSRAYEHEPSYSLNVDWALKGLFEEYRLQKREFVLGNAPRTWHLAGEYWAVIRNYDRAIQCFSRALELGMKPHYVYRERSKAYAKKRDFANAIADATKAIGEMNISSYYENRADIYYEQPDLNSAIKDYTRAISDTKKDMKKALSIETFRAGAESLIVLYKKRGVAYFYKRSWDRAIADYMAAVKLTEPGPYQAPIYFLIAEVYKYRGDSRNESKFRQKALAADPKFKY